MGSFGKLIDMIRDRWQSIRQTQKVPRKPPPFLFDPLYYPGFTGDVKFTYYLRHIMFCCGLISPIVKYLLVFSRFTGLPLGRSRAKNHWAYWKTKAAKQRKIFQWTFPKYLAQCFVKKATIWVTEHFFCSVYGIYRLKLVLLSIKYRVKIRRYSVSQLNNKRKDHHGNRTD